MPYTIVPPTTAIRRKHPAVMMVALPAAVEQSQSKKSEGKKTPKRILNAFLQNTHRYTVFLFFFCHIPTTVNLWLTD